MVEGKETGRVIVVVASDGKGSAGFDGSGVCNNLRFVLDCDAIFEDLRDESFF